MYAGGFHCNARLLRLAKCFQISSLFQCNFFNVVILAVLLTHLQYDSSQSLSKFALLWSRFCNVGRRIAEIHPSASLILRCTNDPNAAACEGYNSPAKTCILEGKA